MCELSDKEVEVEQEKFLAVMENRAAQLGALMMGTDDPYTHSMYEKKLELVDSIIYAFQD